MSPLKKGKFMNKWHKNR